MQNPNHQPHARANVTTKAKVFVRSALALLLLLSLVPFTYANYAASSAFADDVSLAEPAQGEASLDPEAPLPLAPLDGDSSDSSPAGSVPEANLDKTLQPSSDPLAATIEAAPRPLTQGFVTPRGVPVAGGITGGCTWDITDTVLTIRPTDNVAGTLDDWGGTPPWEPYRTDYRSVVVLPGVSLTNGSYMFANSYLGNADLRNLDVSSATNLSGMFYGCSDITSLDLSSFNTANVTDMSEMFLDCNYLESLTLSPAFSTANVTNMSKMFVNCVHLLPVDFSHFNTGKVTDMNLMFGGCQSFTSLDISSFDTARVIYMDSMFLGCGSMTSLDISSFDTSAVISMSNMFSSCSAMSSFTFPATFNTANVKDMSFMFSDCSQLTSLDLSVFNTSNVSNMAFMFSNCSSMPSFTFPASFSTTNVTNMSSMFEGCAGLTSFSLPSTFSTVSVSRIDSMFRNCTGLISLDLSYFNTAKTLYMQRMFEGCRNLPSQSFPSTFITDHALNMGFMFSGCTNLTSVDLSTFNTINVTDMNNMFSYCKNLPNLSLPATFDTAKVTNMNYMFGGCSKLPSLVLPAAFTTASAVTLSGMFGDCSNLASISFPAGFTTANAIDTSSMFSNCSKLTSVDISMFSTAKVRRINSMFNGCSSLTSLTFPSTFTTAAAIDMTNMFNGCSKLTSLDLSTFDTTNVTGMSYMFANCSSMTSLTLPSTFNTANVALMSSMFTHCSSLTSLTLPSAFNTAKVTNMDNLFSYCSSLTSLSLPSAFNTTKVTSMNSMFSSCTNLTSLTLPAAFTTASVTNMSTMFSHCTSLPSLNLSTFSSAKVSNMTAMFDDCPSLSKLVVAPAFKFSGTCALHDPRSTYLWRAMGASLGGTDANPKGTIFPATSNLYTYHSGMATTETYLFVTSTVEFNANGGTFAGGETSLTSLFTPGHTFTPATVEEPTRTNFTFIGWFPNADGSGTQWTSSTVIDPNVTVYAKWNRSSTPLTFTLLSASSNTPLSGGTFTLLTWTSANPAPSASTLTPVDPAAAGPDWAVTETVTSTASGQVAFTTPLAAGKTYLLAETHAPVSYQLPSGQWLVAVHTPTAGENPFTISAIAENANSLPPAVSATKTSGDYSYSLFNIALANLPFAGTQGVFAYVLTGLGILIFAVVLAASYFLFKHRTAGSTRQ